MGKVYIARHGQTAWNKSLVFRGRIDVPLNDEGRREAQALGDSLKTAGLKRIFSSPLSRARDTAAPAAAIFGLDVEPSEGLTDMNFGSWEGVALEEVKRTDPERFKTWVEAPDKLAIPGGETLAQVTERAFAALNGFLAKAHDDPIMVVSHRVVCKLLVLRLIGLGPDRFWSVKQDTACLNVFSIKKGVVVMESINDTCHLASLPGRVAADF